MDGDEGLRTLECLRGRLLAERASSKAANHESEQISQKVIELEKHLKIEIKSRKKAEKRLKFLINKLQSLNIPYVSADDDEFSSSFSEKSDFSSSKPQNHTGDGHNCPSHEYNLRCLEEVISGKSIENVIQSSEKDVDEHDYNGSKTWVTKTKNNNEEEDQDIDHNVDKSMALVIFEEKVSTAPRHNDTDHGDNFDNSMSLVVVDSRLNEKKQDLEIRDGIVKDVLDALKYARESLRASMEMRRHMKSNISQARANGISC